MEPCQACLNAAPFNRHGSRTCGRRADWEVTAVRFGGYGIHLTGWNHASGEPFHWGFDLYQIPRLVKESRFDFTAVTDLCNPVIVR